MKDDVKDYKYFGAFLIYIILAILIIGGGYLVMNVHPNHAMIEVTWIVGLILPILPAYIYIKEM